MKNIFKKIDKEKIINTFIVLVVISLYIAVFMFIYNNFRERKRKELAGGIINRVDEIIDEKYEGITEAEVKYGGYNYTVLGKLYIKKINLNEPILKENTSGAYNTALVKIAGPDLNENGNVSIGGHNFMRGNYFIKINRLRKGDIVNLTDLKGRSINYAVYDYAIYSKDDASYLAQPSDKNDKIITLVTCTKGGKQRYVVKARAK